MFMRISNGVGSASKLTRPVSLPFGLSCGAGRFGIPVILGWSGRSRHRHSRHPTVAGIQQSVRIPPIFVSPSTINTMLATPPRVPSNMSPTIILLRHTRETVIVLAPCYQNIATLHFYRMGSHNVTTIALLEPAGAAVFSNTTELSPPFRNLWSGCSNTIYRHTSASAPLVLRREGS